MSHLHPLLTPRDWQMIAYKEAANLIGCHGYAEKMVEMRRYKLMADVIDAEIPQGWRPSPVEPTDVMIEAALKNRHGVYSEAELVLIRQQFKEDYMAMIAAAPPVFGF